jgi:hypothetical protein
MHVLVDPPPHVLEDETGLRLAGPADGWRDRPDMDPGFTSGFRAAIVARARFVEDLVTDQPGPDRDDLTSGPRTLPAARVQALRRRQG